MDGAGPVAIFFYITLPHMSRAITVVMIASDVERTESVFNFPQEVDQSAIFKQYSVFCETVVSAEQARRMAALAAQAALARGGVAVLIVPGDVMITEGTDGLSRGVELTPLNLPPTDLYMQLFAPAPSCQLFQT